MSEDIQQVELSDEQVIQQESELQIVEMTPIQKITTEIEEHVEDAEQTQVETRYSILDTNKGLVQLDLLNLTLIRGENGEESYQIVTNAESDGEPELEPDATVTCVLHSSDQEDADNPESYVVMETEGGQGPLVFLQSALQPANVPKKQDEKEDSKSPLTPAEIIERAKKLQKAKALWRGADARGGKRKRKSDLPPPHELLASPNFKLYLYSCKLCSFKCNAVKEMSAHKSAEHGSGARRAGRPGAALQCARCPYRAHSHMQLMNHINDKHLDQQTNPVRLDTEEVEAADILVCGACGFESDKKQVFRQHIEEQHGATTC